MELKLECSNVKLEKAKIPQIYLLNANCNGISLTMDVHEELNIFENTEKITLQILHEKPTCTSNDFCGYGYLFSKKNLNDKTVILISIGGFIVRLEGETNILKDLPIMEKVYIKVTPIK